MTRPVREMAAARLRAALTEYRLAALADTPGTHAGSFQATLDVVSLWMIDETVTPHEETEADALAEFVKDMET